MSPFAISPFVGAIRKYFSSSDLGKAPTLLDNSIGLIEKVDRVLHESNVKIFEAVSQRKSEIQKNVDAKVMRVLI